jgi:phospholipid-translocating ATPase
VPSTTVTGQESVGLNSSSNTTTSLIRKDDHSNPSRTIHDGKQRAHDEAERRMRELMAASFDTKYISKEKLTFVDHRMHRHLTEGMTQANISGLPTSRTNMSGRPGQAASIIEFFTLLAVCHTVLVDTGDSNQIKYKSQSPDEEALVDAAKNNGFTFLRRIDNQVEVDIMGQTKKFTILNALEFNSDRKRMSVIVRKEDEDNVVLLCKGADSVIAQRLRSDTDQKLFETTFSHLEAFARDGLRTLCLAYRIIPKDVYEPWAKKYSEAQNLITDRDAQVDAIANLIETDLTLMGATAIEDKLQQGVPECIATLGRAGIKIWVLTVNIL